jgi:hypothetical protein
LLKKDTEKVNSSEYMSFLLTQDKKSKHPEIAADAFNNFFSEQPKTPTYQAGTDIILFSN